MLLVSRDQNGQTWKHASKIRFIACQQAVETFREGSDEDVGHRAFCDAAETPRLDITVPACMGSQSLGTVPRLRPRNLKVVKKEFLPGDITVEHGSQLSIGDWRNPQAHPVFGHPKAQPSRTRTEDRHPRMSMSRQLSTTQGMSIRVSLAKFLHPVCRGAWCPAFAQGEPNHRVRTERVLLGRVRWGDLLAVEPGKQLTRQAARPGELHVGRPAQSYSWRETNLS